MKECILTGEVVFVETLKGDKKDLQFFGWLFLFLGLPLGNTSFGAILLLFAKVQKLIKRGVASLKAKDEGADGRNLPKSDLWLKEPIRRNFVLLMAIMLASSLFSTRKDIAFASTVGVFWVIGLIVFGAKYLISGARLFKVFFPVLVVSSVVSAGYAFFEHFVRHIERAHAPFVGYNGYGTIVVIFTGLGLGYLLTFKDRRKYLVIPYLILSAMAVFFTFSRGGWLGYLMVLATFGLRNRRGIAVFLIVIIVFGMIVFTSPVAYQRVKEIAFGLKLRSDIWQSTILMIRDHPWLGVGPGVYSYVFPKYALPDAFEKQVSYAHNIFLQIPAEFGLLGFVVFFTLLFRVFHMAYSLSRLGNPFYQGLFAGLAGVLVTQQTDNTINGFEVGGGFWLLVGLTIAFYFKEKPLKSQAH